MLAAWSLAATCKPTPSCPDADGRVSRLRYWLTADCSLLSRTLRARPVCCLLNTDYCRLRPALAATPFRVPHCDLQTGNWSFAQARGRPARPTSPRIRSPLSCPPNLRTRTPVVWLVNQGLPGRIQQPHLPVAMHASRLVSFIPNRLASALVDPWGTRSNV